jgi:hypothetical protein
MLIRGGHAGMGVSGRKPCVYRKEYSTESTPRYFTKKHQDRGKKE